jgi:hypothetical protein
MRAHTKHKEQAGHRPAVDLDALLSPAEASRWLGLSRRVLMANVRRKKIPAIRINDRVFRFHPRTILAGGGAE